MLGKLLIIKLKLFILFLQGDILITLMCGEGDPTQVQIDGNIVMINWNNSHMQTQMVFGDQYFLKASGNLFH